jgi:hypothetical protein
MVRLGGVRCRLGRSPTLQRDAAHRAGPVDERLAIIGNVIKSWYADQLKTRTSAAQVYWLSRIGLMS